MRMATDRTWGENCLGSALMAVLNGDDRGYSHKSDTAFCTRDDVCVSGSYSWYVGG